MSNPEPVDGKCNAHPTQDGGYCELDEGWGTSTTSGRCKFHGGLSSGPNDTSKTKMNGTTHGARSEDPAGLFAVLDDDERAWVEQWAAAWRERAGLDEDDPTNMILRFSAVRMFQAMTGERVVQEAGNEYDHVVAYDEETKEKVTNSTEHYLAAWSDRHQRAALRALKDVPNLPGGEGSGGVDEAIVARFEEITDRRSTND